MTARRCPFCASDDRYKVLARRQLRLAIVANPHAVHFGSRLCLVQTAAPIPAVLRK